MVRRDEICQDVERTAIYRFSTDLGFYPFIKYHFLCVDQILDHAVLQYYFPAIRFPYFKRIHMRSSAAIHGRSVGQKYIKILYLQGYPPFSQIMVIREIVSIMFQSYYLDESPDTSIDSQSNTRYRPVISSTLRSALDPPP